MLIKNHLSKSLLVLLLMQSAGTVVCANEQDTPTGGSNKLAISSDIALTVDDINDVAFALQRIRQQAINIYVEATRKKQAPEISAQLPNLSSVPNDLPKDSHGLLPFRRPWLVYFITTLEPLVHLLKEDLKEIESGTKTSDLPEETRTLLDPLIKDWSQGVGKLDSFLTHIAELVQDADKNNLQLAKTAFDIDKEVVRLEQLRDKAFDIIMESPKKSHAKTN